MSGRDAFPERAVAFQTHVNDPEVKRAAIAKLRTAVLDLSYLCAEAEKIVEAFPSLGVRGATLKSVRGQLGLTWHELELAEAAL